MIGFGERIVLAFRSFVSILSRAAIPDDIARKLITTTAPETAPDQPRPVPVAPPVTSASQSQPPPADTFDRAVQILAVLQRDGRLIDFLSENISPYPDAQLGAAVRTIHETCRQALDQYVKLEPVLDSEEDQPVTLQAGFDPSAIKLIGNVSGEPRVRGLLRHKGWRVKQINLPPLSQGAGRMVIAPAEIEIP